jgi:coenzyme F420-reducing hydrogenase delta subunit
MFLRCAILTLVCSTCAVQAQDAATLWRTKVQPLFDVQCVKCHGPIEQKGDLELDSPEAALKGGESGAVLLPGNPQQSPLYSYLAASAETHMPPKKQLTDTEQAAVKEWILALGKSVATAPANVTHQFSDATQAIDALVAAGWKARGLAPAAEVSPATLCRRLYMDLAGRVPTEAETQAYLAAPDREKLVDTLLASPAYAVRMRELWDAFLMGRGKRDNTGERREKAGWWAFLEQAFGKNRPWDAVVREIIHARPDTAQSKGSSWFLYERKNDHQRMAEAIAPVIYGAKLDCAQCHDHPLAREIKQGHYWGLVSAFNRSKNVDGTQELTEAAGGGFANFTNLKKESQPALVMLLTGKTLDEKWPAAGEKPAEDLPALYVDGTAKVKVPKDSRRAAFAKAATTDNPLLAKAFVNRAWAALLGRGLVHPVDEMTTRNVPSHPELLDWMAIDFAKHGYNTQRLVRSLVLSKAYALAAGNTPPEAFACNAERPLMAEQISRSWRTALELTPDDPELRKQLTAALPDVLPQDYNATFQQAQFLSESPALTALLKESPLLQRVQGMNFATQVQALFQAICGRPPDASEAAMSIGHLATGASAGDLAASLLTSAEFLVSP